MHGGREDIEDWGRGICCAEIGIVGAGCIFGVDLWMSPHGNMLGD